MAKILITSVGTGDIKKDSDSDYHETLYKIDGKEYENTLTSQVIVEHYGINKIFFIGTAGSMWDNLYFKYDGEDDKYMDTLTKKKKSGTLNESDLQNFLKQIDTYLNNVGSKAFILDYNSKNKTSEIWENFETLLNIKDLIDKDDEVYLDITHGFRYLPILNIFLLESLKSLQPNSFKIEAILYGLFAGDESEIIDFKIFLDLLDWIKAINNFKKYGDGLLLSELLDKEERKASNVFIQFTDTLHIANIHALWGFIKDVNSKLKKLQQADNKIIKLLSGEFKELAERFDKEKQSDFQFELAKWLYDSQNYALSYIALYEAIVTKSCELSGYDINNHDKREEAKRSIGDDKYGKHFYTKYDDSISVIRNSIVHQSGERKYSEGKVVKKTEDLVTSDIKKLEKFISIFEDYFKIGR